MNTPPLTVGENRILAELLQVAGGMGLKAEVVKLNEEQKDHLPSLKRKGYIFLSTNYFTVAIPPLHDPA